LGLTALYIPYKKDMLSKKQLDEIREQIEQQGNEYLKIEGNRAYTFDAISGKWEEIVSQESVSISWEKLLKNSPFYFKSDPKKLKLFSEIEDDNEEKGK